MEQQTPNTLRESSNGVEAFVSMMKYILSFFLVMLITYVTCTVNKGSAWFSLISAISAGILALIICNAMSDGSRPRVKHYYIWVSALLSFCGIAICYTALGVYPFGEESVMIIDMHHQYSAFFSLMREKVLSFGSMTYSDNVGMGSGFLPLIAYYLCSPYNIIAIIFPRDNLTEAIALIEVLKITTAGATFAIFCRGVFKKDDYGTVALSVAYALNAYFIAYSWDVMWLDCLVLLPLIVYGLEKVMKGESPLLYCITLGLAITSNYYIGYMICIFLVLWYGVRTFENNKRYYGLAPDRKAIAYLKNFVRFIWTSAVGGMLSMWILVPTAISLRETSGAEDKFARDVTSNFDFWDIFSRTLYGNTPTERGDNLPNVYCSVLAVLLIAIFLTCRRIRLRTRVCFGGLLGVLVVLMANNWTNFAFHGFHFPNDLPYRNSFLVCFVMLTIGIQALDRIEEIGREEMFRAFTLLAAMIIVEQKFGGNSGYETVWYSLALAGVYAVIFGAFPVGKYAAKGTAVTVALALCFLEVSANSVEMIHQLNDNEVFTDRAAFVEDYGVNKAAVKLAGKYNKDGSRVEFLPRKTCNDNALYGYSGLTVFASSNPKATTTLMGKLGFAINGVNSYIYNSYVPLVDSALNLKYVIFSHELKNHAQLKYVDQIADSSGSYRYIYENSLALSRGFTIDNDIIYWSTNNDQRYENPFEVQNKFVEYAVNCAPVYKMLDMKVDSQQGMSVDINGSYFYADSDGGEGSFTALHTVANKAQCYIYVDCRAASSINVQVGGSNWNVTPYEPYIIDMGRLSEGSEVRVTVNANSTCSGNIFIAEMDNEALNTAIDAMRQHEWNVTEYGDGHFKGTVSASDNCVMFTSIPYSDGWKVKVDGKSADTIRIGDALLGIYLTPGEHTVTVDYRTAGLPLGITLSVLGVILLVLWRFRKKAVYPLIREYVPVFGRFIDEMNPQVKPISRHEDHFGGEPEEESGDKVDSAETEEAFAYGEAPAQLSENSEPVELISEEKAQAPSQPKSVSVKTPADIIQGNSNVSDNPEQPEKQNEQKTQKTPPQPVGKITPQRIPPEISEASDKLENPVKPETQDAQNIQKTQPVKQNPPQRATQNTPQGIPNNSEKPEVQKTQPVKQNPPQRPSQSHPRGIPDNSVKPEAQKTPNVQKTQPVKQNSLERVPQSHPQGIPEKPENREKPNSSAQPEMRNTPNTQNGQKIPQKPQQQVRPNERQRIPNNPAVLTERPVQKKAPYSTGEVFEITEDNRDPKKK